MAASPETIPESVAETAPEAGSTDPAAPAAAVQLQALHWADPLRWLGRGARDAWQAWPVALFYGLSFWAMAAALAWVAAARPAYTMGLASGCLLLGPFLALGLYDASRALEAGRRPSLRQSLRCWLPHLGSMALLVLLLLVLELLWGRASLVVFAVSFDTGMPSTASVLQALWRPQNWAFVASYMAVGAVFAALVFASTVVALPMILDRDTDALTAALTSARVVAGHPGVLALWGLCIAILVVAALLWADGLPLVVFGPVLGCASWHAYRAAVAAPAGRYGNCADGGAIASGVG